MGGAFDINLDETAERFIKEAETSKETILTLRAMNGTTAFLLNGSHENILAKFSEFASEIAYNVENLSEENQQKLRELYGVIFPETDTEGKTEKELRKVFIPGAVIPE